MKIVNVYGLVRVCVAWPWCSRIPWCVAGPSYVVLLILSLLVCRWAFVCCAAHPLTHALTHSLTRSLTHALTQSLWATQFSFLRMES